MVACRGGRPCPPSKSGDFRDPYGVKRETRRFFAGRAWFFIPLVGADDPVRPLKSCNFVRSFVGADAHIGPSKYCDFASDFRKNAQFRRADRVVRPYGVGWEINTVSPETHHKIGAFGGSMWASTPTMRNGKRGDFRDPYGAKRATRRIAQPFQTRTQPRGPRPRACQKTFDKLNSHTAPRSGVAAFLIIYSGVTPGSKNS